MKHLIVLVVFAVALAAGPRTVSASDLTLPIGNKKVLSDYLYNSIDHVYVNLILENPWTIIDGEGQDVELGADLQEISKKLLRDVIGRNKERLQSQPEVYFVAAAVAIINRPADNPERRPWRLFRGDNRFQLTSTLEVPSWVYSVDLTLRTTNIPLRIDGILGARLEYTNAGVKETVQASLPVDKSNPGEDLAVIREDAILLLPMQFAIGEYPGTLTLTFSDGSEKIFNLQPFTAPSEVTVGIRKSSEGALLSIKGSPVQSLEIQSSSDFVHWTTLGSLVTDTTGCATFTDYRKEKICFYRVVSSF